MNETYELVTKFINWNPEIDVDATKLRLMQSFTLNELAEAHSYADSLYSRLCKEGISDALVDINGYNGDSVHDCLCELVAHGEEYVQHVIENPDIAVNRFKDSDYTENFFYVFPYAEDWNLITADHYVGEADEISATLQGFLNGVDDGLVERYDDNFMKIKNALSSEQIQMIKEVLAEIKDAKWNSNRNYDTIYRNSLGMGHGAWLANVWSDLGKYYARVHTESVMGDGKYRKYPDKS